jgi:hypothetical protein
VRLFDPAPRRALAVLWRRGGYRSAAALRLAEMIRANYRGGRSGVNRPAKRRYPGTRGIERGSEKQ